MRITLTAQNNPFVGWERAAKAIARPPAALVRPVEEAIRHGFAQNFEQQASGAGVPWAPLAPATIADRIRQGYPGARPILTRGGSLRNSYVNAADGDAYHDFRPGLDGWTIEAGSASDIAPYHETGTTHMPARPVSILSDQASAQVLDAIGRVVDSLVSQYV